MTELILTKTPSGTLAPCDPQAAEYISNLKLGAHVKAKCVKARNPKFHRKAFALLNLAFESWEPAEVTHKGERISKSFDRFRKDITILAGYYDVVVNLRGEVRYDAKSLSFSSMDDDEFGAVYNAILDVVWGKILRDAARYKSRDEVDAIVNQLMGF
jgi:hypothetical protein